MDFSGAGAAAEYQIDVSKQKYDKRAVAFSLQQPRDS